MRVGACARETLTYKCVCICMYACVNAHLEMMRVPGCVRVRRMWIFVVTNEDAPAVRRVGIAAHVGARRSGIP